MEMLIVVAIWTVVVKRGVEDIWHTARGGTPPRLAAAKARRSSGAAGRYWGTLWDDTFDDLLSRHNEKRARRDSKPARPAGNPHYARTALRGFGEDLGMWARQTWRDGWRRVEQKRQAKRLRSRPGQQTVPGAVVPNRDETQDGPQDETQDRPQDDTGPEPRTVPTPDGGTDLQFGDDSTDPTGTKQCPECDGTGTVNGEVCLSCRDRQEQRNQHHDEQDRPVKDCRNCDGAPYITAGSLRHAHDEYCHATDILYPDGNDAPSTNPTQEGPTTMTATTTEVTGLESGITFSETSANAYQEMVVRIEQTLAALDGFDVGGPARTAAEQAMEQSGAAAQSMRQFAEELKKHRIVAEAIDATTGAGKREFYTAGR